jgi:hypothetical protein
MNWVSGQPVGSESTRERSNISPGWLMNSSRSASTRSQSRRRLARAVDLQLRRP